MRSSRWQAVTRAAEYRDKKNIAKRELVKSSRFALRISECYTTSLTDARTASRRAVPTFLCSFFLIRERTNQESGPKAAAFGNCSARRSLMTVGAFCLAKFLHLGRALMRPRWGSMAKTFAIPSCLNFRRSQGERQELSAFAKATSEQLP